MTPRDVTKLAFQFAECDEIPFTFEISKKHEEQLTAHFGNEEWRKREPRYVRYLSCVDHYLRANGFEELPDGRKKDSFGCVWEFGNIHHLVDWPLHEPELGNYKMPDIDAYYRDHILPNWPREIEESKDQFRVTRHVFGLFERAWSLRGLENFLVDLHLNRRFAEQVVEMVADWIMRSLDYVAQCPCDAIYLTDDYADQRGVIFGLELFREIFKPHWKRILGKLRKLGIYSVFHVCGNAAPAIPDLLECGVDCLQSLQPEAMDIYALKKEYAKDLRFWGGLGSQSTLPFGTPDDVRNEVRRLKREMGRGGGYFLSGAKSLDVGDVPLENVIAYLEAAEEPRER